MIKTLLRCALLVLPLFSLEVLAATMLMVTDFEDDFPNLAEQLPGQDDKILNLTHPPMIWFDQDWQWRCLLCERVPKMVPTKVEIGKKQSRVYRSEWRLKDLSWSDGTPVTAKDVIRTIKQLKVRNPEIGKQLLRVSADLQDPRKFYIDFARAQYGFMRVLALRIVPPKDSKVSYGSWAIESWQKTEVRLVQTKFQKRSQISEPNFFDAITVIKDVPREPSKGSEAQEHPFVLSFKKPAPGSLQEFEVLDLITPAVDTVFLNLRNPKFNYRQIRKALNFGLNRQELNQLVYGGRAEPYSFFAHPSDPACPVMPQDEYDPIKSRKALHDYLNSQVKDSELDDVMVSESDADEASSSHIQLSLAYRVDQKTLAEQLKVQWSKVGIDIDLIPTEEDLFYERIIDKVDFSDMALVTFQSVPGTIPYNLLHSKEIPSYYNHYEGFNIAGWINKDVDGILAKTRSFWSSSNIYKLCSELAQHFYSDTPFIPMLFEPRTIYHTKNLEGIVPTWHQYSPTLFSERWRGVVYSAQSSGLNPPTEVGASKRL